MFDPSDTTGARWRNTFSLLLGRMSDRDKLLYKQTRDLRYEESDCKRCEDTRDYLFKYSPIIRFMRSNVSALGGELNASNVFCRRCPITEDGQRQGGGFSPDHGIQICANEMRNRGQLEDTLAHEMVHAWDHLRWKVDFIGDSGSLRQAACSEIRASNLSGECRWAREFFRRGQWNVTRQQQECVRRRAVLSVMARPKCKDMGQAEKVVDEVWDSCFADTRPFDEIYR